MAYRFTNTDKWGDKWFFELKPNEKLLFMYLYENCDIAGFIEVNFKKWSNDMNINNTSTVKAACKGIARGLIYSRSNDIIYIKKFLIHQKNYPLNEKNKAHLGIIKRFNIYLQHFDTQNIDEFLKNALKPLQSPFKAPSKPLQSPTGNGNGNIYNSYDKVKYKYSSFYDKEIELSNNDENYLKIVDILFGNNNMKLILTSVLKLQEQLSYEQAKNILHYKSMYNINITSIFEEMENWKKIKEKKTVYKTFITFMKNRHPETIS